MIIETKFLKQNYKGQSIPIGMNNFSVDTLPWPFYIYFILQQVFLCYFFLVYPLWHFRNTDDLLEIGATGLKGHIGQYLNLN